MSTAVVGGTYWETCSEPSVDRVLGSGVRAAAVLGSAAQRLVTVASASDLEACSAVLTTTVDAVPRHGTIEFAYDTPLTAPRVIMDPADRWIEIPTVIADDVIVFGMAESRPIVEATRAIVDPQGSLTLDDIESVIKAAELIVVANRREASELAADQDLQSAASSIMDRTGAVATVIKCGALGALVFTAGGMIEGIPAFATEEVLPIGSGDVFTAAFAAQYLEHGDLSAAALAASRRTSCLRVEVSTGPVRHGWTSRSTSRPQHCGLCKIRRWCMSLAPSRTQSSAGQSTLFRRASTILGAAHFRRFGTSVQKRSLV